MMSTASWNFSNVPKTSSRDHLNLDTILEAKSPQDLPLSTQEEKTAGEGIEKKVVGVGATEE